VFFSGIVEIVLAPRPVIWIFIHWVMLVNVILSLGCSNAKPNTSKPGPRFALVAGALIVTCLGICFLSKLAKPYRL